MDCKQIFNTLGLFASDVGTQREILNFHFLGRTGVSAPLRLSALLIFEEGEKISICAEDQPIILGDACFICFHGL